MSRGVIDAIDRCVGARGCCVVDDNHRLARRVAAAIMAIVPVPEAPWSQRRSGRRHAGDLCTLSRVGEPSRLGSSVTGVLANSREKNGYLRRRYPLYRRRRRNPLSSVRSGTSWGAQTTVRQRRPTRSSNNHCRASDTAAHGITAIIHQPTGTDSAADLKSVRPLRASARAQTSKESSWVAHRHSGSGRQGRAGDRRDVGDR